MNDEAMMQREASREPEAFLESVAETVHERATEVQELIEAYDAERPLSAAEEVRRGRWLAAGHALEEATAVLTRAAHAARGVGR